MTGNLIASSVSPEDLMHSTYREHIVSYLIGLIYAQESVVVIAPRGYGLSRLLRFITYGNYPSKPEPSIKLVYVNLLDFTAKGVDSVIYYLNQQYNEKKPDETLCFIIDELGISKYSEILFKLLKGFSGKDRGHILFILGISLEKETEFTATNPPNYILDLVGNNIFRLPPLSQVDFFKVAEEMLVKFGLDMTRDEIEFLYRKTNGVPSQLKFALQSKFKERFIGKMNEEVVPTYQLEIENGHILCKGVRVDLDLTKAEEGFLYLIIEKRGEVVNRDQLGNILSPESDGTGVSNESIDQVIYRLRKKLIKFGCREKIETYTGRGYGLVG